MKKSKKLINISSFFSNKEILCNIETTSRDEVIKDLLEVLAKSSKFDLTKAFKAVLEREHTFNTIMAKGFAMPHARLEELDQLLIAVATSEKGISFSSEDDHKVNLVVLILAPKNKPALYLDVLSSLSRTFHDEKSISEIITKKNAKNIYAFFEKSGFSMSGVVKAEDIMEEIQFFLRETDNMKKAIDYFVNQNITEIPVVDKDGDLVGIVTAYELLRICLPDYILWMDDLSPIMNFEPFGNILANEKSTWLADIMSYDFAKVSHDSPAMQVAKDITKRASQAAYVVKNKKLVGKITLIHFLDTVLRE